MRNQNQFPVAGCQLPVKTGRAAIPVVIGDIRECPATLPAMRDCIRFWDRWRGKTLLLGAPFACQRAAIMCLDSSVPCDTDLYWPVLGPPEFLEEFRRNRFGDGPCPNAVPVICRHLIVGD